MNETSETLNQKSSLPRERDGKRRSSAILDCSEDAADWMLDRHQLAERLNVSVRTIDRWMARGVLPYYKFENCVWFNWNEVCAYLITHFRFTPGGDL